VIYKCTVPYEAEDDRGIAWNDPLIGIDWPVKNAILSPKDAGYAPLSPDRDDIPQA
jgi:dTDP-4-dehydrorhamnose 3,5-epimerase